MMAGADGAETCSFAGCAKPHAAGNRRELTRALVSPANTHSGRLPQREAQSDYPSGVPSRKTPPGPRPALTSGATARLNASTLSNSRRMPTVIPTPKSSHSFRAPSCDHSVCRLSAHGAATSCLGWAQRAVKLIGGAAVGGSAGLEPRLRPPAITAASPASARLAATLAADFQNRFVAAAAAAAAAQPVAVAARLAAAARVAARSIGQPAARPATGLGARPPAWSRAREERSF